MKTINYKDLESMMITYTHIREDYLSSLKNYEKIKKMTKWIANAENLSEEDKDEIRERFKHALSGKDFDDYYNNVIIPLRISPDRMRAARHGINNECRAAKKLAKENEKRYLECVYHIKRDFLNMKF